MSDSWRDFASYIASMVSRGGPRADEYDDLTTRIAAFDAAKKSGLVTPFDERVVFGSFGEAVSLDTVQGLAFQRPYGYPGDFEVIDRIYTQWLSPQDNLRAWDEYFHAQAAPKAVRNRKRYFHRVLDELAVGGPSARSQPRKRTREVHGRVA